MKTAAWDSSSRSKSFHVSERTAAEPVHYSMKELIVNQAHGALGWGSARKPHTTEARGLLGWGSHPQLYLQIDKNDTQGRAQPLKRQDCYIEITNQETALAPS